LTLIQCKVTLQEVLAETRGGRLDAFPRFCQLVEDQYYEHWDITEYARALAMTPPTLNRLCRQFSGEEALELIQNRLVLEFPTILLTCVHVLIYSLTNYQLFFYHD
jgi:hypothetical protein